ncbi:MAG: DNA topoisomerase VI, partial [Sulfolobales archaeon]
MKLTSSVDVKVRKKALEVLRDRFKELVNQILAGENPTIVIPKRTLSNTVYDESRKLLLLGPDTLSRSFLDVRESKKFMQTVLMASIIYNALTNDEYPTIRDLFYRGKHTIRYRGPEGKVLGENTWDSQRESDSIIRDLEVFINMLREELLILSKEKGKVVGNMRIRSGDDVIDLSKMGHGAYSIEPTPDLI